MEVNKQQIVWVAVVVAAAVLPVVSALTAEKRHGSFAKRWIMCWIANGAVFCLVLFGFAFQGFVDLLTAKRDPYPFFSFHLTWAQNAKIYLAQLAGEFSADSLGPIALLSVVISWATLFGKNWRQWAIFGCRAAFLTYVIYDVLVAIVVDASILELIKNVVFDLVGAILFGAAASVLISLIFGRFRGYSTPDKNAGASATSAVRAA